MGWKTLEALSNALGPSGCEEQVRQIVVETIKDKVDDYHVDNLGNVIAFQKGTAHSGFKVMVSAHMDEVGFMISHADDSGMLHFVKVGGIDDRVLPAKVVRIGEKKVPGVICIKPVHLTTAQERTPVIPDSQMVIDIGASSKDEAQKLVSRGDYATFDTTFAELGDMVKGKAFDDRAGCAVLVDLIEKGPFPFDFYPVFTTMEEIGLRGAKVAGYSVMPDAAFALEGTICDDGPKEKDESPTTAVGKGPVLSPMDRSIVADARLLRLLVETAEQEGLPYQFKQPLKGSTDTGAIHLSQTGVPAVPVSIPCRFIHSPVAMLGKADFENTVKLMTATLRRLTPDVVAERE